ncbi:MAG: DUF6427 family protein [Sphingobacteriales bacterium]|jgi:hypothetical protein|nr:DUF6427 family protein [Sphingobacteriales bacterium]
MPAEPVLHTPFAELLFNWLKSHQLFTFQLPVMATVLLFLQALLINYITGSHDILYKGSVMPGLFFVLLNSIYPEQLLLSPQLLANTFIILLLHRLCYLYESDRPLFLVFDAAILLGIGLLLDYDLIIYLFFILLSVLFMTAFNLRYWLAAIFGIIIPSYFLGVYFFLTDQLGDFLISFQYSISKSYLNPIGITWIESLIWFIIIPIFVFSTLSLQLNFLRNKVKTRRIQVIILLLQVFGVISVLAQNQMYVFGLAFLSVSLSVIMANYFIRSKRKLLKDILFLLLLICMMYYHFIRA